MADVQLLGEWLDRELATAPHELAVRVRAALPANWREVPTSDATTLLASSAAQELRGLLERGCETRWAAPGLLTVDALVTYACELLTLRHGDLDAEAMHVVDRVAQTLPIAEARQ